MKCPFVIKVCTKCKRILVANEINFYKDENKKYGLRNDCKACNKQYRKNKKEKTKEYNKQYYNNNKEYHKKYNKQYRKNNKEELSEYHKQYKKNNKECLKQYYQEYYQEHKEEIKEYKKQYYKDNPDKVFNQSTKRRLLEEKQGNGITKEQWLEMMEFFDWKCAYSGIQLNKNNRSIDHIIPISLGGENEIWNLIPMLKSYNSSKHTDDMIDWYIKQDFFDIDRLLKIYEWIEYAFKKWNEGE